MTQTVVVISIGPVQGFIAAARRMRDFAYGSRLLVELARITAQKLNKQHTVIFPAQPKDDAPNKIVVLWNGNSANVTDELMQIKAELVDFIANQLTMVIDAIESKHNFPENLTLPKDSKNRAKAQVRDILEFYWAYADAVDYKTALNEAEYALAARKSLRDFAEFPHASTLPKSSITGHYESIIPEDWYNNHIDDLRRYYGVRGQERLSGIDLLKRHGTFDNGNYPTRFPSPAVMAARTSLYRASLRQHDGVWKNTIEFNNKWKNTIDSYIQWAVSDSNHITNGDDFDESEYADWFFTGRISEDILTKSIVETVSTEINKLLRDKEVTPYPYYAMLLADGDRMGKIISACTDASLTNDQTKYHVEFSEQLSNFAKEVRAVVLRYDGQSIYTGGDDVLAIVPVYQVVQCAVAIQELFQKKLADQSNPANLFASIESKLDTDTKTAGPSVSIGVAIVHHLEPLQDVIELVRKTEQVAKRKRNSLAICLAKRSGTEITITGQWSDFPERVQELSQMFRNRAMPSGYAYELREMLQSLDVFRADQTLIHQLRKVVNSEAKRILDRKKTADGVKVNVQDVNNLRNQICIYDEHGHRKEEDELTEWIDEIIIARELQ